MAVLKFRVYWEEDDVIYRDVLVKHTQNFADLHQIILMAFEFDKKHDATFLEATILVKEEEKLVRKYMLKNTKRLHC